MERNENAKKIKKIIVFVLVFLLSLNVFLYYIHVSTVWDEYEAVEHFSGNREHFDRIVEIVLTYNKKSNCTSYDVTDYGILSLYEIDSKLNCEEIPLSKNDISSLKKAQETLGCYSFHINVKEYGVSFYRDEKTCAFIYIYEGIDIGDINSEFIREPSDFWKFKKIEKNWYNILPKRRF